MNYFETRCGQPWHCFARDNTEDEAIQAYHLSGDFYELCKGAEFNLAELLDGDLLHMYHCPSCDRNTLNDDDHIRVCIGYQTPYTREQIEDCYSDRTESAKKTAMLNTLEG